MQPENASFLVFLLCAVILAYSGFKNRAGKTKLMQKGFKTLPIEAQENFDMPALSKFIGNFLLIISGVFVLMAIATKLFISNINLIMTVGLLVIAAIVLYEIVYMNVGNKFKKQ